MHAFTLVKQQQQTTKTILSGDDEVVDKRRDGLVADAVVVTTYLAYFLIKYPVRTLNLLVKSQVYGPQMTLPRRHAPRGRPVSLSSTRRAFFWIVVVAATSLLAACNGFVVTDSSSATKKMRIWIPPTTPSYYHHRTAGLHKMNQDTADQDDSMDNIPSTPCNRICRYNADFFDGQVCIGCYREPHEIASWASMDAMERYWTLLDSMDRREGSSQELDGSATLEELQRQAKYWEEMAKKKKKKS